MADTRCRWCGLWLLPSRVGDGFPWCDRKCKAGSLTVSAFRVYNRGQHESAPAAALTAPERAHSPNRQDHEMTEGIPARAVPQSPIEVGA